MCTSCLAGRRSTSSASHRHALSGNKLKVGLLYFIIIVREIIIITDEKSLIVASRTGERPSTQDHHKANSRKVSSARRWRRILPHGRRLIHLFTSCCYCCYPLYSPLSETLMADLRTQPKNSWPINTGGPVRVSRTPGSPESCVFALCTTGSYNNSDTRWCTGKISL